ncbi:phosphonate ABC transporter ATP-binding protein [Mycolicibacterium sp. jd]|uniref:phosphonate ABC transporter ATP-binding protein n=1 Tax=unclassified Mycolicibacterium TaxID=2636767 RepID=UPI00351B8AB5
MRPSTTAQPHDSSKPALETRGLDYRYPDGTQALEGVDIAVRHGEIVAVLGPSGAGKSTLFRCLAGLAAATSGCVLLDGADLARLRRGVRRRTLSRIGLVFQEFHLVGRATVLSNVLIGRLAAAPVWLSLLHLMSRRDRERAVELLHRLGLAAQVRKRADALSGGQRQRVALARALAQEPRVLLADEPVANLDPVLAAGVVDDIVRMVQAERLTAVLNLHDVSLARQVAGRIVGMRAGRVLFDLPTEQVSDELLDGLYSGVHDGPAPETAAGPNPGAGGAANTTSQKPPLRSDPEQIAELARLRRPSLLTVVGAVAATVVIIASARTSDVSVDAIANGLPSIADFVSRMFPPDWSELGIAVALMWETLGIAITGTVVGLVFAVPIALLAARTVYPSPWVRQPVRLVINGVRAIPELMWALLFVSAVGLGALAGTLAIIVGTAFGVARLFSDIFEATDVRAWDAATATGARRWQRISWVLLPQQIPTMTSYSLLILDSNVRAASLLGLVGAGGIGMELQQKLRLFDYGAVFTIVIVVLVVIVALDQVSSYIRKRLV